MTRTSIPANTPPATGLRDYVVVTANYWSFTLSDGALRMLVLLFFYQQGYSPLALASLFLLYEVFGVVTNLVGGYLGARLGLNKTMQLGLGLQVLALGMLLAPISWLTVPYVMASQALSGIAKDLNKMSAKSAIKLLLPEQAQGRLYSWVALLTGSKNAMKGVGFFLGGILLAAFGFQGAIAGMAGAFALVWLGSLWLLPNDLGRKRFKPKFRELFAKSAAINWLSAARLFLFGARDVWFVVALPVTLASQFGWSQQGIGSFLALWVIGYGVVQALAPKITGSRSSVSDRASAAAAPSEVTAQSVAEAQSVADTTSAATTHRGASTARTQPEAQQRLDSHGALGWALVLCGLPALLALGLQRTPADLVLAGMAAPELLLLGGLLLFGVVFAINSSLHSYLIVKFAARDGVSLDVGFYYMANALGRLIGTLLSGAVLQAAGFSAVLWVSSAMLFVAVLASWRLSRLPAATESTETEDPCIR